MPRKKRTERELHIEAGDYAALERIMHRDMQLGVHFPARLEEIDQAIANRFADDPDAAVEELLAAMVSFDTRLLMRVRADITTGLAESARSAQRRNCLTRFELDKLTVTRHLPRLMRLEEHLLKLARHYTDTRTKLSLARNRDTATEEVTLKLHSDQDLGEEKAAV